MPDSLLSRFRCWSQRLGLAWLTHYVDLLVGRERTVPLEVFLGVTSLATGLWILHPAEAFGPVTLLANVPESITAGALIVMGGFRLRALYRGDVLACLFWARVATAIWSGIAISFVILPPRTVMVVPITAMLAGANWLISLRLWLLYARHRG
jgi:hypothetical protein